MGNGIRIAKHVQISIISELATAFHRKEIRNTGIMWVYDMSTKIAENEKSYFKNTRTLRRLGQVLRDYFEQQISKPQPCIVIGQLNIENYCNAIFIISQSDLNGSKYDLLSNAFFQAAELIKANFRYTDFGRSTIEINFEDIPDFLDQLNDLFKDIYPV